MIYKKNIYIILENDRKVVLGCTGFLHKHPISRFDAYNLDAYVCQHLTGKRIFLNLYIYKYYTILVITYNIIHIYILEIAGKPSSAVKFYNSHTLKKELQYGTAV